MAHPKDYDLSPIDESGGGAELTNQGTDADIADATWRGLYKVGGVAALIVAAILVIEIKATERSLLT